MDGAVGLHVPYMQTGGSWILGGGLVLASHNPRCWRMARMTEGSSMLPMTRMAP